MLNRYLSLAAISSLLLACNSSTTAESNSENKNPADSAETEAPVAVEIEKRTTLPGHTGVEISDKTYVVEEIFGTVQSEYSKGQTLSVVLSEEQEFFLEIGYEKTGLEESWLIDLPVNNPYAFLATLEYTDANYDGIKDELVIWWSDGDGNNGINSGYEMQRQGVIIFDVMQRTEILNLVYVDNYLSYAAGENANTDDPEFHAKMAEDSEFTICSYSHDVSIVEGEVHISNFYSQSEGMDDCKLIEYVEGVYKYNVGEEVFKLKE